MKYMLLIYGAEDAWTDAERSACMIESLGVCDELAARGKFLSASPLASVKAARTVRVRAGEVIVTGGPFAETTEQLGGYYVLNLEDLDEAIAVAAKLPPAKRGTVEIRPIYPLGGLPPAQSLPSDGGERRKTAYMLLCYDNAAALEESGPYALEGGMAEAAALARNLSDSGAYLDAAPLHPADMATCVRVRDGRRTITDGPFAETNEVLGGYYVVLAASLAEAMKIAARHPGARAGSVEVRPLFDLAAVRGGRENSTIPVDLGTGRSTR